MYTENEQYHQYLLSTASIISTDYLFSNNEGESHHEKNLHKWKFLYV